MKSPLDLLATPIVQTHKTNLKIQQGHPWGVYRFLLPEWADGALPPLLCYGVQQDDVRGEREVIGPRSHRIRAQGERAVVAIITTDTEKLRPGTNFHQAPRRQRIRCRRSWERALKQNSQKHDNVVVSTTSSGKRDLTRSTRPLYPRCSQGLAGGHNCRLHGVTLTGGMEEVELQHLIMT